MKKTAYVFALLSLIPFTASAFTFTRSLSPGSSGDDVTALQQFLNEKGYLSVEPTGYYGALTEAAVEQYQSASGIVSEGTPQTTGYGAVGPKTLESLNGGATTGKATLIAALMAEVRQLEAQINAILASQGVTTSTASNISQTGTPPTTSTPAGMGGGGGSTTLSSGSSEGGGAGSTAAGNTSAQSASVIAITTASTSATIAVGGSVIATANLNVRQSASPDATSLGAVQSGTFGTVIGGPTTANGHTWWQVSFTSGLSGWCIEDYLVPAASANSPALGAAPYVSRS